MMDGVNNQNPILLTLAVVGWVSFLGAAIATMLFFATFDPEEISSVATFPIEFDRTSGYSIGFLCFWALLMINGGVIAWLSNTQSKVPKSAD